MSTLDCINNKVLTISFYGTTASASATGRYPFKIGNGLNVTGYRVESFHVYQSSGGGNFPYMIGCTEMAQSGSANNVIYTDGVLPNFTPGVILAVAAPNATTFYESFNTSFDAFKIVNIGDFRSVEFYIIGANGSFVQPSNWHMVVSFMVASGHSI